MRDDSVSILLIDESHLPEVAEIERLCFSEPWSEQSLRLLLGDGGLGVVAVKERFVLAYGGMNLVLDEGSVTNIAVHPAYRRLGLGREVTRALLRFAKEKGVTDVFLEVRESNLPARTLYKSFGYREDGKRRNFYSNPREDAVLMSKDIDASRTE